MAKVIAKINVVLSAVLSVSLSIIIGVGKNEKWNREESYENWY